MELFTQDTDLEKLNHELNDDVLRAEYAEPYNAYKTAAIPRFFGMILMGAGNVVYGKKPSYLKFRAIELVARVPYYSWESAVYTLLTLGFSDERKALRFSRVSAFSRIAQDNETMHVVVISHIARNEPCGGWLRRTALPVLFAAVYFWIVYIMYLCNRRWALEVNYLFENHAYHQYSEFLDLYEDELRHKPVTSDFLAWYGRTPRTQYEFFQSVRNDELIHRNMSVREIAFHQGT